jgi:hypothetical protein
MHQAVSARAAELCAADKIVRLHVALEASQMYARTYNTDVQENASKAFLRTQMDVGLSCGARRRATGPKTRLGRYFADRRM